MLEPDDVTFKEAEIRWCWEMFDRIIEICQTQPYDKAIASIAYYAKLGVKGRKDEWNK